MIENTTVLNKEALIALNITLFKKRILPITIILEVLLVVFAIIIQQLGMNDLSLFLWVFVVFYPLLIILSYVLQVRKIFKSDKLIQDQPAVHFVFDEDSFEIEVNTPTIQNKSRGSYDLIHHVMISKNYLFLFQNSRNAYVVGRNSFSIGDSDTLIQFLKKKNVKIK